MVQVPADIMLHGDFDLKKATVETIYPDLLDKCKDQYYLEERAILTTKNETVDEINDFIIEILPGS